MSHPQHKPEAHRAPSLSDLLVEVAQDLCQEKTEAGVRAVTCRGFTRAGLGVAFYGLESGVAHLLSLCAGGRERSGEVALARRAWEGGRAVFAHPAPGAPGTSEVYLPVGERLGGAEVLVVCGPLVDESQAAAFNLFACQVAAALASARAGCDSEHRNHELRAVAEVARLAAATGPSSLEQFLATIAQSLACSAVLLHQPDESGAEVVLAADFGVDASVREKLSRQQLGEGLAGQAAAGVPRVLVGASGALADELRAVSGGRLGAGAAVKLEQAGKLLGVLSVLRAPGQPLTADDLPLLRTLGDLLVARMEQRRLLAESSRQLNETRLLLDLARTTAGTLELETILDIACDFLVKLLDSSNCFILLHDEEAQLLRGAASSAEHRQFFRTVVIPLDARSVAARTARERRPVAVEDVSVELDSTRKDLVQRFREKAILGLPMVSRGQLVGVVVLDDTRGPRRFGPAFIELAEATVGQVAMSIANARLYASLKDSYAALAETRAEMVKRERLAALGELSAVVAHEVRNPLGVIFNAVSALRRQLPASREDRMLLDIIREEGDRLNAIVGELLDFARPRALSLQPEDMGRVVQESLAVATSVPGQRAHEVRFEAHIETGLPLVPLDPRLMRQALVNVALNAVQAMPRGGKVTVRVSREVREGRQVVRIDVTDEGGGIAPEIAHRIFEPFFTTKAKGTGLGLAVVKRILEDHEGEVEVCSAVGQGTTFTFRLPMGVDSARTPQL